MSALVGNQISYDDIAMYKKDYTQGKEFQMFLARNAGHESAIRAELA